MDRTVLTFFAKKMNKTWPIHRFLSEERGLILFLFITAELEPSETVQFILENTNDSIQEIEPIPFSVKSDSENTIDKNITALNFVVNCSFVDLQLQMNPHLNNTHESACIELHFKRFDSGDNLNPKIIPSKPTAKDLLIKTKKSSVYT